MKEKRLHFFPDMLLGFAGLQEELCGGGMGRKEALFWRVLQERRRTKGRMMIYNHHNVII